ncbi:hypothetical protein P4U43_12750 [Arthrobacter sp. EH-1B-1]|uniref:IPT/TIG domain-containing protein n=1 Tax=Arthrobacter vasquezii TaxID=2977629 RepID=A0ABT6CX36_9MICC|nr:hypothetical protein [Arthrobacter vasquezii]MDF9278657.1 hypothetical protein [Arthrobacter vasquezii]
MSKLPAVLALTVTTTLLLVGCTNATGEPEARTTTASASPSPSATPTPEETATEEPAETPEPSAEPSPEPSDEPSTPPATEAPAEPAPTLEPLPTAPGDPFVPPPHGEPNPGTPFVPPPHGEPNPFAGAPNTVTPGPVWGSVQTVVQAGTAFTITGSGYQPGQRITVFFGPSRTDYSIIGEQSAYAGPSGNYSFTITLSPDITPGTYGVLTATPDGMPSGQSIDETRRWATIEVVAP